MVPISFRAKINLPRVVIVIYIYLDKAVEPPEEVLEFIRDQKREMGLQNTIRVWFAEGPMNEGKFYAKRKV